MKKEYADFVHNYPDVFLLRKEYNYLVFSSGLDPEKYYYDNDPYTLSGEWYRINEIYTDVLSWDKEKYQKWLLADKVVKSVKQRKYRYNKTLKSWFDKGYTVAFLTLNFNDKALKLKPSVRRKYIQRYLNDHCLDYQANIDYGEEKGREHYHATCLFNKNDFYNEYFIDEYGDQKYKLTDYNLGFGDFKFIDPTKADIYKNYVFKRLVNHAVKDSTLVQSNIMRKRNK